MNENQQIHKFDEVEAKSIFAQWMILGFAGSYSNNQLMDHSADLLQTRDASDLIGEHNRR